jgi:hypothetical protein
VAEIFDEYSKSKKLEVSIVGIYIYPTRDGATGVNHFGRGVQTVESNLFPNKIAFAGFGIIICSDT